MARRTTVTFAASAFRDLEEIRRWYEQLQIPEVGERLLREVIFQVERLAELPESGRIVPELGITQLREILHPPFRIVYRVGPHRVRVVRVWCSERLLKIPE